MSFLHEVLSLSRPDIVQLAHLYVAQEIMPKDLLESLQEEYHRLFPPVMILRGPLA